MDGNWSVDQAQTFLRLIKKLFQTKNKNIFFPSFSFFCV